MKAMSKAELELEKLISKLEGQLASAHYALNLMRSKAADVPARNGQPMTEAVEEEVTSSVNGIPLFS